MGRIKTPAFKLEPAAKGRKSRKQPAEFRFKVWKPLPGQLKFREIYPDGDGPGEVHLARKRKKVPR